MTETCDWCHKPLARPARPYNENVCAECIRAKLGGSPRNRKNKYKAEPTTRTLPDGTVKRFHSKQEALRYDQLRLAEKAGRISDIELQPSFSIDIGEAHITRYVADFAYQYEGERIIEDVKGYRTDVYKLKKKLVEAIHGITLHETKATTHVPPR